MSHAQNSELVRAHCSIRAFQTTAAPVVFGTLLALLAGCGGAPVQRPPRKMAPYAADPDVVRYPKSLRLAALGRVHQRAGFDALAAEYFRGAYRSYPELNYMLDYAQASERAHHFAEAYAAYTEALQHNLDEGQRSRLNGEAERLKTLVSPSLVPVTVQVQPYQVQVLFTDVADRNHERMVLGDGTVWLRPGTYTIQSKAPSHKGEKRQFRVGVNERQMLTVHLRRDSITPVALVAAKGAKPVPVGTAKPAAVKPAAAKPVAAAAAAVAKPAAAATAPAVVATVEPQKPAAESAPASVEPESPTEKPVEKPVAAAVEPEAPAEKPAADEAPADEAPADEAPADEAPVDEARDEDDEDAHEVIEEPAPASGGGLSTWGPIITAGLGVAALGAGGYFYSTAVTHQGYANDLNEKSPNYDKNFDEQVGLARDNLDLANWSLIGGGTLVGLGTAWFVLSKALGSSAALPTSRTDAFALKPSGIGFNGRQWVTSWRF